MLCFVVVMQSFIMNSHELFIHIHQGCFAGTGAIVRLPQCQWSKPDGYGKISQYITTTKQKPCAYFLGYTVCVTRPQCVSNMLYSMVQSSLRKFFNYMYRITIGKLCKNVLKKSAYKLRAKSFIYEDNSGQGCITKQWKMSKSAVFLQNSGG